MKRYEIKRFLLSSVLTLGVSSLLLAQSGTVAGRVTDTDTGDPLVGANVTVMEPTWVLQLTLMVNIR